MVQVSCSCVLGPLSLPLNIPINWRAVAAFHGQSQHQTILFQEGGASHEPLCGV